MAINIIDGFYLGGNVPIDSRFSVLNLTERNNIQYKYDGLRVYVSSEKKFFYWDSSTSSWKEETSGLSGSGTPNRVSKFLSGGLTNSVITSTASFVGINTEDPKDTLQISRIGNPIVVGHQSTFAYTSYNSWYTNATSTSNFQSSQGSSIIRFNEDGSINFLTRRNNDTTFLTPFQINASFSSVRYNVFNGLNSIGTASFGNPTSPNFSNKLVSINGSTIFNSSIYYKSTWISFNGTQISVTNVDINGNTSTTTTSTNTYTVQSSDHNIIIQNTSLSTDFNLSVGSITAAEVGREIKITYQTGITSTSKINISSSGADILDENGTSFIPFLRAGQSIKITAVATGVSTRSWKVVEVSDNLFLKGNTGDFIYFDNTSPNKWKSIPFESKMREILSSMSSTSSLGTFRLKFGSGNNLSEILFQQSGTSSVRISGGGLSGNNGLFISNNGKSFITSNGISNDGTLYITSNNNNNSSANNTSIKIQTTPLQLPTGSTPLTDTVDFAGSIQIASRTKFSITSQTGDYFLGDRTGGINSFVLPPSPGTTLSANLLMLGNDGRIYRSFSNSNIDSSWIRYSDDFTVSPFKLNPSEGNPTINIIDKSFYYKKVGTILHCTINIEFDVTAGVVNGFNISTPFTSISTRSQKFTKVYSYTDSTNNGGNIGTIETIARAISVIILPSSNSIRVGYDSSTTTGDFALRLLSTNPETFSMNMDLVYEVI